MGWLTKTGLRGCGTSIWLELYTARCIHPSFSTSASKAGTAKIEISDRAQLYHLYDMNPSVIASSRVPDAVGTGVTIASISYARLLACLARQNLRKPQCEIATLTAVEAPHIDSTCTDIH